MCSSPGASFSTAALTGVIGLISLSRVTQARELPLAATPLLFGVQQAIEGGLWLALPTAPHGPMASALTLIFLLFAQAFWPVYAPLATLIMEPDERRRQLMLICLAIGLVVSGYLLWRMLTGPRDAAIVNSCIVYQTAGGQQVLSVTR
jgi:dolichol kinase